MERSPEEGATTVPAPMAKSVVEALLEKVHPPPLPLKVVEAKSLWAISRAPAMVLPVVVALKVTPLESVVNVAPVSIAQLPASVMRPACVSVALSSM